MVTTTCGFCARSVGKFPDASALSHNWTSASAFCCARVRSSPCGRAACTSDSTDAATFSNPTASRSNRPLPPPSPSPSPSPCRDHVNRRPSVGSGSTPSGSSASRYTCTTCASWSYASPTATARIDSSIAARSTSRAAAAASCSSPAIGAIVATCPAVSAPTANAAAVAGRCSNARPERTSRAASACERCPCPRSHDCMVFNPSCSAAPVSSHRRTVRVTSAAIRFCTTSSGPNRSSNAGPTIPVRSSAARASTADCNSPTGHLPGLLERVYEY
jgi:hypothetical protein